jgi:hypothetical protein
LAQAQATAPGKDEAASKAMLKTLEDAVVDIENINTNPVVAGVYVIEANQPLFMENQKVKKAIYFMPPHSSCKSDADFCEEYEIGWKNSPENVMEADSMFLIELVPAADDAEVALWLSDSLITEEQVKDAYYIKSVKYNKYANHTDPEIGFSGDKNPRSWYGIHLSLQETPQAYMVLQRDGRVYDIWMPGGGEYFDDQNGNLCFHLQGHSGGAGKEGHIVYWRRGDANSVWNLRYVSAPTSIGEAPVVEGEEVVSTTYYTADGAVVPAPVKGVNIVKYVYSNGAVKSVKFVK